MNKDTLSIRDPQDLEVLKILKKNGHLRINVLKSHNKVMRAFLTMFRLESEGYVVGRREKPYLFIKTYYITDLGEEVLNEYKII